MFNSKIADLFVVEVNGHRPVIMALSAYLYNKTKRTTGVNPEKTA